MEIYIILIGYSEWLCLEYEWDKLGIVRGYIGDNRECETLGRGSVGKWKDFFMGDFWRRVFSE